MGRIVFFYSDQVADSYSSLLLSVITVMYMQVEKSDCYDDNPSVEFQFNVHACLQMPAVVAGNLPNVPALAAGTGATAETHQ